MSYKGAVSTGGFPPLAHQQSQATQAIRASIAVASNARNIQFEMESKRGILDSLSWYSPVMAHLATISSISDDDRRKLTKMVNGWAY